MSKTCGGMPSCRPLCNRPTTDAAPNSGSAIENSPRRWIPAVAAGILMAAASLTAADPVLELSLRHAVEIATSPEGNARIQLATELTRQSESRSTQARAALLPSIDGSVTGEN